VDILIPYLDKDRTRTGKEFLRYGEAVPQVGKVTVDAVPPGVPECLDLFRFAGNVIKAAVLDIPAGGRPLEIGVELDAVGRVKIDTLHLAL
jgi:hypothetical protein